MAEQRTIYFNCGGDDDDDDDDNDDDDVGDDAFTGC
jgi:hypothetical protein